MSDNTVLKLSQPSTFSDPLTEVLRSGARSLLARSVEAEVAAFLDGHSEARTEEGRRRLVRHGHLPEREIMTGIGPVAVRAPRVRDASQSGAHHAVCCDRDQPSELGWLGENQRASMRPVRGHVFDNRLLTWLTPCLILPTWWTTAAVLAATLACTGAEAWRYRSCAVLRGLRALPCAELLGGATQYGT